MPARGDLCDHVQGPAVGCRSHRVTADGGMWLMGQARWGAGSSADVDIAGRSVPRAVPVRVGRDAWFRGSFGPAATGTACCFHHTAPTPWLRGPCACVLGSTGMPWRRGACSTGPHGCVVQPHGGRVSCPRICLDSMWVTHQHAFQACMHSCLGNPGRQRSRCM